MPRSLRNFSAPNYDRGRPLLIQAAWLVVSNLLFRAWYCPRRLRPILLRCFGARVGERVVIRSDVRVHWPWKLSVGDDTWIGESSWLLNLEPIDIGNDVCVSQQALLCTGSHDMNRSDFPYRNAPIRVGAGAWIAARAVVLPGVTVGRMSVVPAGSVLSFDLPECTLLTVSGPKAIAEPS